MVKIAICVSAAAFSPFGRNLFISNEFVPLLKERLDYTVRALKEGQEDNLSIDKVVLEVCKELSHT